MSDMPEVTSPSVAKRTVINIYISDSDSDSDSVAPILPPPKRVCTGRTAGEPVPVVRGTREDPVTVDSSEDDEDASSDDGTDPSWSESDDGTDPSWSETLTEEVNSGGESSYDSDTEIE